MKLWVGLLLSATALLSQPLRELVIDAPSPAAVRTVSATYAGTVGGATYYYWVIANYPVGRSPASPPAEIRNVGILSAGSPVLVRWTDAPGATSYDVLRTDMPLLPGACNCAVATGVAATSVSDTGAALQAYTLSVASGAQMSIAINNADYPVAVPVLRLGYERLMNTLRLGTIVPASCQYGESFLKTDAPVGQKWYYCSGASFEQTAGSGGTSIISGSAALDFGSIADGTCADLTFSLLNAVAGRPVMPGWPQALPAGLFGIMAVSAQDTIRVRLCNLSGAAIDPPVLTYQAGVL